MIVDDLDVKAISGTPEKADPPLIIDADAVLPGAFALQGFETVPGRNPEVFKGFGGVQHDELSKSSSLEFRRKAPGASPLEETFRVPVMKTPDHRVIITEPVKAVNTKLRRRGRCRWWP